MAGASPAGWPAPVEAVNEAGASDFVLVCEHAANHVPADYGGLGLPAAELARHIAWDIGAGAVTRALARRLDAPAFLGTASRLLVDLNRPLDAPSSMPVRSEATDIPGNAELTEAERARRARLVFEPFHAAVARHLDHRAAAGRRTLLLAVHSFTPVFHGLARPWHAGVLFGESRAFGEALIAALAREAGLSVGANVPYVISREEDYTIPVHGHDRGIPAVLLEIRQDLLASDDGIAAWVDRLAAVLPGLAAQSSAVVP